MINILALLDQIVVVTFSAAMIWYSFRGLNNCTKETPFMIRIRLILYLPASVGIFLLALEGTPISWLHSLILIATTLHLISDRRYKRPIHSKG